MFAVKIILCLTSAIVLANSLSEEVFLKTAQKAIAVAPTEKPKNARAVVVDSNLPLSDQNELAVTLQIIFNSIGDPLTQALEFQRKLDQKYPMYNTVAIDYKAIVYYQRYYAIFAVNGVYVIAFGL